MDIESAIAHWREHGWARLGRVLDDAELERLRARANAIMLGEVKHEGLFFQHDTATGQYGDLEYGKGWEGPSLAYRKLEKLELDPVFLSLVQHPTYERIVRRIIEGDVTIYRAMLMSKSPGGGSDTPWHQDGGAFWGLDRDPELQIWTALDDAPDDGGCLEVLDGSHIGGLVTKMGGLVPASLIEAKEANAHAMKLPALAGEAILVHCQMWHRSQRAVNGQARRAFTTCYMSAATKCRRKKRAPRTFFPVFRSILRDPVQ